MKKWVAGLLLAWIMTGVAGMETVPLIEGDFSYAYNDDHTVTIVEYLGTETMVAIPNELNGQKVTGIGPAAFADCAFLTQVSVPEGITQVAEHAFYGCLHLAVLSLPESLTDIGEYAFSDCDGLTAVILPSTKIHIGENAFYDCDHLTAIMYFSTDDLAAIADSVLLNANALEDIPIMGEPTAAPMATPGAPAPTASPIDLPDGSITSTEKGMVIPMGPTITSGVSKPQDTTPGAPKATPIPVSEYARPVKDFIQKNWKIQRFELGLSKFEVAEVNGMRVAEMEGWAYADHSHYNGRTSLLYLAVMNEKQEVRVFNVQRKPGISALNHVGDGIHLEDSDFRAVLNVAEFPDGVYQLGMALHYTTRNATYKFLYTFGDAYVITVQNGEITQIG